MMKHEFEALAGYEVSTEDYEKIIEPMYLATDLTKQEFVKTISKQRFALKPLKKIIKEMRECAESLKETCIYDNLKMGYYSKKDKAEFEKRLEEVYESFPILKERSSQIAGTLSGGEQQMLAMSRALMSSPKLLLLDEPSMGLSPLYVNIIFDMIKKVNALGTTVLLVEQNAKKALSIADRAYVLEIGKIVKTGTGKELLDDEDIRKAYLGG